MVEMGGMRCAMKALLALFAGIYSQMPAGGAIPVSSVGTGVIAFNIKPSLNDWTTLSVGGEGDNGRIVWPAELDADVQHLAATNIVLPLGESSALPPSQNNAGIWNSAGQFLQTKVGNNAYGVIMATLRNDTESDVYSLAIGYDLGVFTLTSETIRGYRTYFNLTGQPGSWQAIPELCVDGPGSLMTVINPGLWPNGAVLYLLWVDDNAVGSDTAYSIDNFFAARAVPGASITLLTNGQTFREGAPIPLHANAASDVPITEITFFDGFAPVGAAFEWPFSIVYSNASPGGHDFVVIAGDASGNFFESETVHVEVLPNTPPLVTFASPSNGVFAAGDTIPFVAMGRDYEGSVVRVDFYVDGILSHHYPYFTSPYPPTYTNFFFSLSDVREGRHTITAVAVDDATFHATNTISIMATNPPGVVSLVPNGAVWKYADDGLDQGTAWRGLSFNDTGWKQGAGEFGFGDGPVRDRPESTQIVFGPDPKKKPLTTYFRRSFMLRDPAPVTKLVVRL